MSEGSLTVERQTAEIVYTPLVELQILVRGITKAEIEETIEAHDHKYDLSFVCTLCIGYEKDGSKLKVEYQIRGERMLVTHVSRRQVDEL